LKQVTDQSDSAQKKKKKKKKKEVTDHLTSSGTTSHGPLEPLTNTKTPHGQNSAHQSIKQNKYSTKAKNFKVKRESQREQRREKERVKY
jgi:hypothetical protein